MEEIELVEPKLEHKLQAKEMLEETMLHDVGNLDIFAGYASMQKYSIYEEWLKKLEKDRNIVGIENNRVRATTYFLIRRIDNKIIGIVNIRYYFNAYLENYGGHIGYSIRPTERKKGYGHKQLMLALEKCKQIPINRVLITCRQDNIKSAKTIEACGGILENVVYCEAENDEFKRYWIDI